MHNSNPSLPTLKDPSTVVEGSLFFRPPAKTACRVMHHLQAIRNFGRTNNGKAMSHEKVLKEKHAKKSATKTLKEKRAEKKIKEEEKKRG